MVGPWKVEAKNLFIHKSKETSINYYKYYSLECTATVILIKPHLKVNLKNPAVFLRETFHIVCLGFLFELRKKSNICVTFIRYTLLTPFSI